MNDSLFSSTQLLFPVHYDFIMKNESIILFMPEDPYKCPCPDKRKMTQFMNTSLDEFTIIQEYCSLGFLDLEHKELGQYIKRYSI